MTETIPKSDLSKTLSFIGFGGIAAFCGMVFIIYDAVNQSDANSEILSCTNLINHQVAATDNHWLMCLMHGNAPWTCQRGSAR